MPPLSSRASRCFTPNKGDDVWTFAPKKACLITTSPVLVVTRTPDGYRRQLYVGCGVGGKLTHDLVAAKIIDHRIAGLHGLKDATHGRVFEQSAQFHKTMTAAA